MYFKLYKAGDFSFQTFCFVSVYQSLMLQTLIFNNQQAS